jgi:hypothetical protein
MNGGETLTGTVLTEGRRAPYGQGVDESAVATWFADYLAAFAALGRGESPPADVVGFYSTPFLLTTDDMTTSFATVDQVDAWLHSQAVSMAAAGYHRTDVLDSSVEILNHTTAVLRSRFSRLRVDGTRIGTMTVTYLVTGDKDGLHIAALVLHSP